MLHGSIPLYVDIVVTIFAVISAINAFDMVDGIDGLFSRSTTVVFASLGIVFFSPDLPNAAYFTVIFIVILVLFILFNLGYFGKVRKVFMENTIPSDSTIIRLIMFSSMYLVSSYLSWWKRKGRSVQGLPLNTPIPPQVLVVLAESIKK
ncbi:hypothetical protein [Vibrio sp. B1Z05]|uniref:hypothetical protein n=1 Tax=Vibrio sp. B1Z05 TaxID=2654980 RepID=UPI00128E47ED|nr:hypothetical protein [Vibrio sp. B1Z05]MPW36259.1 hypothetical protein [Vibrio sp. B1Z05]